MKLSNIERAYELKCRLDRCASVIGGEDTDYRIESKACLVSLGNENIELVKEFINKIEEQTKEEMRQIGVKV